MDDRIDLSALELDQAQRELLIAAILTRADAELTRRAQDDTSPIQVLSTWVRPALAAAAALAMVCTPVLWRARAGANQLPSGLADALAVPAPAYEWLATERAPTIGDVLLAMESEGR
jgi:hypothetical protein